MFTDPLTQIEAACEANGLVLSQVLAQAGVAQTTWWRWKENKFEPRAATLRKIQTVVQQHVSDAA